jgi:spore germination cell wall hydrolase CwlJ-like protein
MSSAMVCLAIAVFFECAVCSDLTEKAAIAHVIMNRANDIDGEFRRYTHPCDVLKQPGHFSFMSSDIEKKWFAARKNANRSTGIAMMIASSVLLGSVRDPTEGATHYHLNDGEDRYWAEGMLPVWRKGWHHVFWREGDYG